jgi:hypothetical protein
MTILGRTVIQTDRVRCPLLNGTLPIMVLWFYCRHFEDIMYFELTRGRIINACYCRVLFRILQDAGRKVGLKAYTEKTNVCLGLMVRISKELII